MRSILQLLLADVFVDVLDVCVVGLDFQKSCCFGAVFLYWDVVLFKRILGVSVMKLAIIGQSAFGKAVLESFVDSGRHDVAGIFAAPDGSRGVEPLAESARLNGIPTWQFSRMRDSDCIDTFNSLDVDVCVMAYVTDIVPLSIIESPRFGTIQYHPSLLPLHRGPSSINWAIINGDSESGLTIFWPDAGLDTGPILMQKSVEIGENDTVGSIYFERLFPMGVDALLESVDLIESGDAPCEQQDESIATYEGWCGDGDARVDWGRDVSDVHNLIRGCDPQPGAWGIWGDSKVSFFGSCIVSRDDSGVDAGTVTGVDDSGVSIAVSGGLVKASRVRVDKGIKLSASEIGFSVGNCFR